MKKNITFLSIITFILIPLCPFTYGYQSVLVSSGVTENFLKDENISESSKESYLWQFLQEHKIQNVNDYAEWLKNNVHYEKGSGDSKIWTAWPVTLSRLYGNCKDISLLNSKVLKLLGYKPVIIGYKNSPEAHVLTVFNKNGQLNIFDNVNYYETRAKSLEEIAIFLYSKYNVEIVFEVNISSLNFKLLYTRPMLVKLTLSKLNQT